MAAQPLSILFDLDGTVVDSKPGILASCNAALRSLGHRPDSLDNAQQAAVEVEELLFRGHPDVVDADLADYLEAAPQLMK